MRLLSTILALVLVIGPAAAGNVPLPPPRPAEAAKSDTGPDAKTDENTDADGKIATKTEEKPEPKPAEPRSFADAVDGLDFDSAAMSDKPTPCDQRLAPLAVVSILPRLIGPGACGGSQMVMVEAILLPDKSKVTFDPAPLLQCPMAESLAAWVREEVAPEAAKLGATLSSIENYNSFECRDRNRVKGAKLSEHGKGNAIDVRAIHLTDKRRIVFTDANADRPFRTAMRDSACRRFTTVLGPGDPYHSEHIHLDILARRNGYRICQWDVREPPPPPVAAVETGGRAANDFVPLPPPRPAAASVPGPVNHPRRL